MTSELGDDSTGQAGSLSTSPDPVLPKTGPLVAGKYRIDGILGRGGGEQGGVPFIVMERLVGNDLADELRLRPLDPETTVRYLFQAREALAEPPLSTPSAVPTVPVAPAEPSPSADAKPRYRR